jgi:hypothetical protein
MTSCADSLIAVTWAPSTISAPAAWMTRAIAAHTAR